ncbi:hypothetical protein D3C86_1684690 [compost metagenome]
MLWQRRQCASLGLWDLEYPDLIAGDVLEDNVPRFGYLRRYCCRAPVFQCFEIFPDQMIHIQMGRNSVPVSLMQLKTQVGTVHKLKGTHVTLENGFGAGHKPLRLSKH